MWGVELSSWASLVTIFGGSTLVAATGVAPRLGPLRAITLALKSRIFRVSNLSSSRKKYVDQVVHDLKRLGPQNYIVVVGPKGIGKTSIVATALKNTCGVVSVDVSPGTLQDDILDHTFRAVSGLASFVKPVNSAKRVLFFYRCMWFLPRPIIWLSVHEVPEGKPSAQITGAVRILVEKFSLRVIVDSSDHSSESRILATKRQEVVSVELMTAQEVMTDKIFQMLFCKLHKHNLDKLVWAVVGGNAADLNNLNSSIAKAGSAALEDVVHRFIVELLRQARKEIDKSQIKLLLVNLFKEKEFVYIDCADAAVVASTLVREKPVGIATVLVPATPALGVVLKHDIPQCPKLGELQKMFADGTSP